MFSYTIFLFYNAGSSLATCTSWMLAVDGMIVCEAAKNQTSVFLQGLAVLFASHYILNIHYDGDAEATLEFIQR